jgi:hypothetical protein
LLIGIVLAVLPCAVLADVVSQKESFAEKSLKGIEKQYRSILAQMSREPLRQRKFLQEKLDDVKERMMLQQKLLGVQSSDNIPQAQSTIAKTQVPRWADHGPGYVDLNLRELPEVEEWIPNYGRTGKERRAKKLSEKIVLVDQFSYSKPKLSAKRTNAAKKVMPWELNLAEQGQTQIHLPTFSKTRVLQFAVPKLFVNKGKWWLWKRSAADQTWRRMYRYDLRNTNVTDIVAQAQSYEYKFTPELKSPGDLKADYAFIVDTEVPIIKSLELKKNKEGQMRIEWNITEKHLKTGGIVITIYGKKGSVLGTHATTNKKGGIPVNRDHKKVMSAIDIEVVDRAANRVNKRL